MLGKVWEVISSPELDKNITRTDVKRIILTSQMCFFATAAAFFIGLVNYWMLLPDWGTICWAISCSFLIVYKLNRTKYYKLAKSLLLLVPCVSIFVFSSFWGKESGFYLLYFPILFGTFGLFNYKEGKTIVLHLLLPIICLFALELTDHSLFLLPQESTILSVFFKINLLISVCLIWIYIYYFIKVNEAIDGILLRSQANLNAVIENTQDCIWSTDLEFNILTINSSFKGLFQQAYGISLEKGMQVSQHLPLIEQEVWKALRERALKGEHFVEELCYTYPGLTIHVEVSVNPIYNKGGAITGISFFSKNITHRKQAEEKLRFHASILLHVNDAVIGLNNNFSITYWNRGAERIYGLTESEVMDKALSDIYTIQWTAPEDEKAAKLSLSQNGYCQTENIHVLKNGKKIYADAVTQIWRNEKGEPIGLLAVIRDITQNKQAEEELRRTNFELDSFVYRSSHDLRAPLRSILGLVNLIRIENNSQQRNAFLDFIEKSIHKLDTCIWDMTNFSKNSRQTVKVELIDFRAIVNECMENLKYMANAERLSVKIKIDSEVPFYSDAARINIIFHNLLSNAIKYQNLYINNAFVSIDIASDWREAHIIIADNGKGIEQEHLNKIFDMFFKASSDSYGSGLGLYITKQIVEKLNGTIQVESNIGAGTQFILTIPHSSEAIEVESAVKALR